MELIKDNCAMMDNYSVGDEVQAQFNLSGRLWSGNGQGEKCFTSLQAWRVTPVRQSPSYSLVDQRDSPPPGEYDDIPF